MIHRNQLLFWAVSAFASVAWANNVSTRGMTSVSTGWVIGDAGFLPEGIAYDSVDRTFYLSSRYRRKIARIDSAGGANDFVTAKQDGLWWVIGIAVDAKRRHLWAASSSFRDRPGIEPSEDNRAGVFCFAIPSGRLVCKIIQEAPGDRYLDDVAIAPDGRVFVSDPGHGAVLVTSAEQPTLTAFIAPGKIRAPQGLALTPDGSRLFISDYAGAIWWADLATGNVEKLAAPPDLTLGGLDGLAYYRGSLIGIFNPRPPYQLVRLPLDATERRVERREILAENDSRWDEPTTGIVVGDDFYYVANSQGVKVGPRSQPFNERAFSPPTVLRLPLSEQTP